VAPVGSHIMDQEVYMGGPQLEGQHHPPFDHITMDRGGKQSGGWPGNSHYPPMIGDDEVNPMPF